MLIPLEDGFGKGMKPMLQTLLGQVWIFAFDGSSVTLYSIVFASGSPVQLNANTALYSLDGNATFFDLPGSMIAASVEKYSNISNYPLFHRIQPLHFLDIYYFLIKTNPRNSSFPGNSSSSSNGSSSSSGNGPSSSSLTSGSSHKSVGAIVGGTVAGVAGLAALILLLFWFSPAAERAQIQRPGYHRSHGVTPFEYVSQPIPAEASEYHASPQALVRDEQDRRNEIRRHLDSGVRIPSAEDAIVDVPPTYTRA
ncbi:hypothetical protein BDP27DRAFT_1425291 [Rhodocollybia butyracea]|uniref:Uncharacterized protein n=1 Tax=Rhodocollybia butyracea TaxID=206335 RepID=A0A9P5U3V3_9AGAR|nr:hypothetical protein BDP27DRAFT_1425291 [Rhodocollybia butyracea]